MIACVTKPAPAPHPSFEGHLILWRRTASPTHQKRRASGPYIYVGRCLYTSAAWGDTKNSTFIGHLRLGDAKTTIFIEYLELGVAQTSTFIEYLGHAGAKTSTVSNIWGSASPKARILLSSWELGSLTPP